MQWGGGIESGILESMDQTTRRRGLGLESHATEAIKGIFCERGHPEKAANK